MIKTKDIKPRETTEDPFKKNVACEHLLMHRQLEELRDLIRTSISKQSLALISGPPGVGKTTAIRSVTDELPAHKYTVVYLGQDHNSANVLRRFALSLGMQPKHHRPHLVMQISRWLMENHSSGGKQLILIVDEAHLLDDQSLEEFRLMTNADYDRQSPLTMIFVGQPLLRLRMRNSKYEALAQRITYRYFLEGLDEDETTKYIRLRLLAAGAALDLFSEDALHQIFQLSQGVPRKINTVCSLALLKAKSKKLQSVDAELIKELIDLD